MLMYTNFKNYYPKRTVELSCQTWEHPFCLPVPLIVFPHVSELEEETDFFLLLLGDL